MAQPRETPGREGTAMGSRATELVTDQGKTIIADTVVAKIAAMAAREVTGVHELVPQGAGAALVGLTQRVIRGDTRGHGVQVEVGEREAAVYLKMVVTYGVSIHQVAEGVRRNIIARVHSMTGLTVREVNIEVSDLFFPEDEAAPQPPERRVA
jgi:uncharacterized alkaline shock family protein YloU